MAIRENELSQGAGTRRMQPTGRSTISPVLGKCLFRMVFILTGNRDGGFRTDSYDNGMKFVNPDSYVYTLVFEALRDQNDSARGASDKKGSRP